MTNTWPEGAPKGVDYVCFFCVDEQEITRRFQERFGRPPEYIFDHTRMTWAGPVTVRRLVEVRVDD